MKILVSNDDGIDAPGLWELVRALNQISDVTVVAPDREQSGVGTSVTFHKPLRIKEVSSRIHGVKAYSVEGTPADSVILALRLPLSDHNPDLIVSGINEGANLGDDVFISGTVGAALQGYFYGMPAISVSVNTPHNAIFSPAAKLVRLLAACLISRPLPERVLLNINLPNLPIDNIKDILVTRLAERKYVDGIKEGYDGRRKYYWIVRGEAKWLKRKKTDQWALENSMISVTPLLSDSTRSIRISVERMLLEVFQELTGIKGNNGE